MSPVIIEFRDLFEYFEWSNYNQLFSQYGLVKKLYIDPQGAFGKVYFDTFEEATAAFEELDNKPPLHLKLSKPVLGDYIQDNMSRNMVSTMNHRGGYEEKYYDRDMEACIQRYQYVDVFGRLISTVEGEDGDIYVSLTELKKSGFELYQAGTLPKPGQSTNFDKQLLYQFEMYMKMKATKFLSVHKLSISQDSVNSIINKEINSNKAPDRIVEMDKSGLLKISASPISISKNDALSINRYRMSTDGNDMRNYSNNRLNQKHRATRSSDQFNQRNDLYMAGELNNRFSNTSNDSVNEVGNNSYGKSNQRGGLMLSKEIRNPSFTKRFNNRNESSSNDGEFRKSYQKSYSNNTSTERQQNKKVHNAYGSDSDDNHSIMSAGGLSTLPKPLMSASLTRNKPQKEQDGTYNVQVKKCSDVPQQNPIPTEPLEKINSTNINHTVNKNESNRRVSFAENTETLAKTEKVLEPVTESVASAKNNSETEHIITSQNQNSVTTAIISSNKSVVEVSTSDVAMFECIDILTENSCIAFIAPNSFSAELCEIEEITTNCKPDPSFKPNIGDFVAVLNETEYVRGTVLNIIDGKYSCALVDFGKIITAEKVCALPDKFKNIPEFSCVCQCDPQALVDIASHGEKFISVAIIAPGKLSLKLESAAKEYELTAYRWNPFVNSSAAETSSTAKTPSTVVQASVASIIEKPTESVLPAKISIDPLYKLKLPVNQLKEKDIVIITAEQRGHLLVRTRICNTLLKQVNLELANYEGKPLTKPPEVGQLAVASFNDDGFYRVIILSVKDDNAMVEYIDYGNSDSVPIKMLLSISQQLAEMDNTLIKIKLKDFNEPRFSEKVLNILEECGTKKDKFTVIPQVGKENEYDLLYTDQTSLSEKLISLDKVIKPPTLQLVQKPAIPKPEEKVAALKKAVQLSDLPASKFKIGINEVMCMHTGEINEGNVSFCLANQETSDLLIEVQLKISEYCAKSTQPYEPDNDEICLAKFADEWYRACVLDKEKDKYNVFYIDFGNSGMVSAEEICSIPAELTKTEPLASLCILKGVIREGESGIQESLLSKIKSDLQENEMYSINVLENVEGYLIITIPTLYESWTKQGLL